MAHGIAMMIAPATPPRKVSPPSQIAKIRRNASKSAVYWSRWVRT
jgi:hypothetical protein